MGTVPTPRRFARLRSGRMIEMALGAFALAVGFGVLGSLDADVLAILFSLGLVLMGIGVREIASGFAAPPLRKGLRILEVASGTAIVGLGFFVAVFPGYGVANLLGLLFLGLFAFGVAQAGAAAACPSMRPWFRGYTLAIGVFNLLIGPLLLLTPAQPRLTFILLASVALVVDGIAIVLAAWLVDRGRAAPSREPSPEASHP